jgi:hypothetical protein
MILYVADTAKHIRLFDALSAHDTTAVSDITMKFHLNRHERIRNNMRTIISQLDGYNTGKTSPETSKELFFVMRFARCISAGLAPGGPVSARICGA